MIVMKRYILLIAVMAFAAVQSVSAQDLDPTVVVNRAYEGKLMEVHKPSLDMEVPDSVTRFDLDFDYSVFDKPYQGSYEFNPYVLTMQPASAMQAPRQLYLKAGAGYTLHPLVDFVWSPTFFKKGFRMDVYASHRSYIGGYRTFKPELVPGQVAVIDRWVEAGGDHSYWKGYDLQTKAGVDGGYDWKKGAMRFDGGYYGVVTKDEVKTRHFDALDVRMGVFSKSEEDTYFRYDVNAEYRYGHDVLEFSGMRDNLGEHVFSIDGQVGQVIERKHNVLFRVGLDLASYSHPEIATTAAEFSLVPHYVFGHERWSVDAGIRLAKVIHSDDMVPVFTAKDQVAYPDVSAWFDVIPEYLRVYSCIGGGNKLNTYSSLLERNHHFDPRFGRGLWPLMDVTVERVSASLGFKGRVGARFSYDLRGGYVNYANAPLDAIIVENVFEASEPMYLPAIGYTQYQKLYASLDWMWDLESFRFDGAATYGHFWGFRADDGLFAPASLTGDVSFEYNWSRRIYAGVDCEFATARKGSVVNMSASAAMYDAVIPGYADLGVYFEYATNRALSFWIRGGNLLNMTIQRNPLFAEKGINFTAGICLNL